MGRRAVFVRTPKRGPRRASRHCKARVVHAAALRHARRRARHDAVDAAALFVECRHHRAAQFAAARQLDAHRIDEASVDADFVVDMRAGREAGRADEADHLALADARALFEIAGERGHVAVGGLVAVVVAEHDELAVARFPAGLFDDAVAGGEDRRAGRGRPVHAGVHLGVAEDRMAAQPEAGAHHARRPPACAPGTSSRSCRLRRNSRPAPSSGDWKR